jgi:hypothetical protein
MSFQVQLVLLVYLTHEPAWCFRCIVRNIAVPADFLVVGKLTQTVPGGDAIPSEPKLSQCLIRSRSVCDVFPSRCNLYCFGFDPTTALGVSLYLEEHCSALICDSRQARLNGSPRQRLGLPFRNRLQCLDSEGWSCDFFPSRATCIDSFGLRPIAPVYVFAVL